MKRILLFIGTNIAVLVVLSIVLRVLGVESLLAREGVDLNYEALLVFAAVFGMGGSFISLAISKWIAKMSTGARVIEQPTDARELWLVNTVKRLARQAGIGMPEVAIYDSPVPNAFATGMRRDSALVAVSTGLLANMSQDEVEAVLGHEVSHVANGDMVTLALLQGVMNTFVIFAARVVGHFVDRVILRNDRGFGLGYFAAVIVAQIVFGILASVVVFWFSRRREFRADQGGAQLAGREKMISALQSLGRSYGKSELPDQIEAFGISGKKGKGITRLFMSHPPLEDRIAALRNPG